MNLVAGGQNCIDLICLFVFPHCVGSDVCGARARGGGGGGAKRK